jgi:CIC family chloride channel protein
MSTPTPPADSPAVAPPEPPPGDLPTAKRNGRSSPLAAALGAVAPPLDLRILGRTLLHTALVGFIAGLLGAAFFAALEYTQAFLLESAAGYTPLRAHGEKIVGGMGGLVMHPIVMLLLPAAGALLGGIICLLAPETRGGGGDAMIHSFHHQGGVVRARVIWVKALASILTLGSGGSGGREGPTMQMGGALGSAVGLALKVGSRERRILMIAGVAAGMAAVFRTPLGAALLAAEVLYRDDFEAEALVPAVLASVISYSVVISIFGESTLFARAPRYPFIPRHLPLYGLLAVMVAFVASLFLSTLRGVQELSARLPVPVWARPAAGGLALSLIAVPLILVVGARIGSPGRALGIFGGGYGAAQIAIAGADWLPLGWRGAELLLFLCLAKLLATSFTIGTGGSAGDFGPSLVLGGLFGGAFGHAAKALLHDPSIDPGAFALVGMGTFYGGLAHVPVSSLVMVCELAGSYDLLVPLMLAEGIAFVALRKRFLYEAQLPTHADSPVHRVTDSLETLARRRVSDVLVSRTPFHAFEADTKLPRMRSALAEARWQTTFPVLDRDGKLIGLVSATSVGLLQPDAEPPEGRASRDTSGVHGEVTALHIMQPPAALDPSDDLRKAAELILLSGFRQLPVIGADHKILGFLQESEITRAYLGLDPRRGEDSHRDPEAA